MTTGALHGLIAEFDEPGPLLEATRQAYAAGYRRLDAYTPFHVEGVVEALGMRNTGVPIITLLCGITGGLAGYGMQYYAAAIHYPLNIGGRPLHSWPAFVPITFELTILFAALGTVIGMLILNGLPRHHQDRDQLAHLHDGTSHTWAGLCLSRKTCTYSRSKRGSLDSIQR
jgi:hypothetical protein